MHAPPPPPPHTSHHTPTQTRPTCWWSGGSWRSGTLPPTSAQPPSSAPLVGVTWPHSKISSHHQYHNNKTLKDSSVTGLLLSYRPFPSSHGQDNVGPNKSYVNISGCLFLKFSCILSLLNKVGESVCCVCVCVCVCVSASVSVHVYA